MSEKVSKHFMRKEFACHCGCGFSAVDVELLGVLEDIRREFNAPVQIVSGCRCKKHNENVKGVFGSKHILGIAADIKVIGYASILIFNYLTNKYPGKYGIGEYNNWIHIDVREIKARWRV